MHICPYRNGCYKENAKTSDFHKIEAFKTQYFKERFKIYEAKIVIKNIKQDAAANQIKEQYQYLQSI